MLPLLMLVYYFTINILLAVAENAKASYTSHLEIKNPRLPSRLGGSDKLIQNLTAYIDKTENILRIPDLKKNYEEHNTKKKNPKKTPKRTVQKIVKKNRSKKKLYLNQATVMPTKAPRDGGDELDKFYAQEELMQKNENMTNLQSNQKKKKRWPATRYPMPFQHLATKKDKKRNKRSEDRKDVFILTDFDSVKFLEEGDTNVVNAHIKRYW